MLIRAWFFAILWALFCRYKFTNLRVPFNTFQLRITYLYEVVLLDVKTKTGKTLFTSRWKENLNRSTV